MSAQYNSDHRREGKEKNLRIPFFKDAAVYLFKLFKQSVILILLLPIKFYQYCLSPLKPPTCRYTPTCSQYAIEAIHRHGPFKGLLLAVKRLLRCHPWGGSGYDPVP